MARSLALPTLSLVAALAGCMAAPAPTGGVGPSVAAQGSGSGMGPSASGLGADLAVSAGASQGAAQGANTQVGLTIGGGGPAAPAGATSSTSLQVGGSQGPASGGLALDPKAPGFVSAKAGGVVTGPNGIQAMVPPGALTRDAIVKLTPRSTSGLAVNANYIPGILFDLDLGGAALKPGTQLMVSTLVDPRFVPEMQRRNPAFKPEAYSLKQNAQGQWEMSMAVKGPHVGPVTPDLGILGGQSLALLESGSFPLPGARPAARRLLGSTEADCKTWLEIVKKPVPTTMGEWRTLENEGTWSCDVHDGKSWFMNIFYDLQANVKPCGGTPPSPGASVPPVAPVQAVPIPAHVTWESDDPSLSGKDAEGALVRFDIPWTPANGPAEVQADAAGKAASATLSDTPVQLTAFSREPDGQGPGVQATAKPGMAAVELRLPKFSPKIRFVIDSEEDLGATTTVSYTLDGEAKSLDLPTAGKGKAATVEAFVRVPDDAFHAFTITNVQVSANSGVKPPLPGALQIRRNGQYEAKLSLILTAAH